MHIPRTSTTITLSVWNALFLREVVGRLSAGRAAWLWLLLEPLVHVVFLAVIFSIIRISVVGGIKTSVWIMVGMLAYFMFQRTATQTQNAVNSNRNLFTYRQVKPVDTVLVRGALEGLLTIVVAVVLFAGAILFGVTDMPRELLSILEAFFGLWLLGTGFGLMSSVAGELIPELGKIIGFMMTPLYFASGVLFPITVVPQPYRDWLLLNPIAHGIEAARLGFAYNYHTVPEVSIAYVYGCALVAIFLGLALHVRFATKIVTQ